MFENLSTHQTGFMTDELVWQVGFIASTTLETQRKSATFPFLLNRPTYSAVI